MKRFLAYLARTTGKREFAASLMIWLLTMATIVILDNPAAVQIQVLEMFSLSIPFLAAGAFGLEWVSKETNIGGSPTGGPPTKEVTVEETTVTSTTNKDEDIDEVHHHSRTERSPDRSGDEMASGRCADCPRAGDSGSEGSGRDGSDEGNRGQ